MRNDEVCSIPNVALNHLQLMSKRATGCCWTTTTELMNDAAETGVHHTLAIEAAAETAGFCWQI